MEKFPNNLSDVVQYEVEQEFTRADTNGAIITRGPAIVSSQFLNYNGKTEADVDAALLAKNILVVKPAV